MQVVIQEHPSGCAIASSAALAGCSYKQAAAVAKSLGIEAGNQALWSQTTPVRRLLSALDIQTASTKTPFQSWQSLPDCALLAIKWHQIKQTPYWHWVVFSRENDQAVVLDSKAALKQHRRTDFGRIKPKWFIEVLL